MRADTHVGPEQMLHIKGLIHCCSSHVRRSWSFRLATHGRAIHMSTKAGVRRPLQIFMGSRPSCQQFDTSLKPGAYRTCTFDIMQLIPWTGDHEMLASVTAYNRGRRLHVHSSGCYGACAGQLPGCGDTRAVPRLTCEPGRVSALYFETYAGMHR